MNDVERVASKWLKNRTTKFKNAGDAALTGFLAGADWLMSQIRISPEREEPHKPAKKNLTHTEIPWNDPTKWTPGKWYPMPHGFMKRNQPEYIIEGYGVYKQDETAPEDIDLVAYGPFIFSAALEICESHNGEKLLS